MSGSRRSSWTLGIVSVALFMAVLDNLVVSVALPTIHRDLGASIQSLEWTVNAYVLAYAVLLLTGAALGDRFGRKRMFVVGLALFTAASAAARRDDRSSVVKPEAIPMSTDAKPIRASTLPGSSAKARS